MADQTEQMSLVGQLSQLSAIKTLADEIIEQLQIAEEPMTCAMLLKRIPNAPDRETLSREIYLLAKNGRIVRSGEVEAPPGTPRQSVACYALSTKSSEGEAMPNITINAKKTPIFKARESILKAITGIDREHSIKRDDLVARADSGIDRDTLINVIKKMCVEATVVGAYGHTAARRYFDIRTLVQPDQLTNTEQVDDTSTQGESPAPSPEVEKSRVETLPQNEEEAEQIEFSIYNDGRLAIIDGDEVFVIPPDATRRLGYFLGCLEMNTWPPRLDPHAVLTPATA